MVNISRAKGALTLPADLVSMAEMNRCRYSGKPIGW